MAVGPNSSLNWIKTFRVLSNSDCSRITYLNILLLPPLPTAPTYSPYLQPLPTAPTYSPYLQPPSSQAAYL